MNTFHFFKTERKFIFNIAGRIGIMSQFHMVMKTIFFFWNSQAQMPFHSYLLPGFIPFFLCTGANEILHFHLFKFSHAENKLPGYDLISKGLSYLCNTKRNFQAPRFLYIQKVYKNSLGCFRS